MNEYERKLIESRNHVIGSIGNALENGVTLPRVLEVLGVEGKPAIMLRALLGRFDERELAVKLRELANENPSSG